VYTGPAARDNGLIDGLGGLDEARDWLQETHGIDSVVPLRDVVPDYPNQLVDKFASTVFGISYLRERLTLDGLVSLWHPSLTMQD
ncbi:MAG: signal peptide peptidase SppA, partial [Alphaproteobacteria bacterium]